MDQVVGHLVRRGLDAHETYRTAKPDGNREFELPAWGITSLVLSAISFVLAISAIEYTYGYVVATLAMVESPTAILFESVSNEDPDAPLDDKKIQAVEELVLVKEPMITSNLRRTIMHLRAHAGYLSRFRGLSVFVVHGLLLARLTGFFRMFHFIPVGVDGVLAAVLLARLRLAWTHIVISEASPKYWFQRLADNKAWKKIVGPTAILSICEQLAVLLPLNVAKSFGLQILADPKAISELNCAAMKILAMKVFTVFALGIFMSVAVVIPVTVSLTRVQASLLSEEEETVVPFDRSFGGKLSSAIAGGSGVLGLRDAWKTFDWNSRIRLIKIYLKVAAMQLAVCIWILVCVTAQLHVMLGKNFKLVLEIARSSKESEAAGVNF